jgi:hypothetical protein
MRADASEAERPWVSDVWSFCAVSCAERSEYADVNDYTEALVQLSRPVYQPSPRTALRTEGVEFLC